MVRGLSLLADLALGLLQVLRERPPGYGGIERVAHELAQRYGGTALYMSRDCKSSLPNCQPDPLPVSYRRMNWPVLSWRGILIPFPILSRLRLILSDDVALLLHLPCTSVLLLGLFIVLFKPSRPLHVYWHAFLDEGVWHYLLYQRIAIWLARRATTVITTSPVLIDSLSKCGIQPGKIVLLPPVLPVHIEAQLRCIPRVTASDPIQLLCLGRLSSYKRFDWVIEALGAIRNAALTVAGSGPDQPALLSLATQLGLVSEGRIRFLGRISEHEKLEAIAKSHLLILAADSCHEAFGIAQLEAMAAGRVSISFEKPRSGMSWVNGLNLPPHHPCRQPADLISVVNLMATDSSLLRRTADQARLRFESHFSRLCWLDRCRELEIRLRIVPSSALHQSLCCNI